MRHHHALLCVLLSAGVCEAQDRTRTRPPPSPPATKADVEELRATVEDLRKEVAKLREQMASLLASVAEERQPAVVAKPGKLAVGMTLDQVRKLTTNDGQLIQQDGDAQRYKWVLPNGTQLIDGNKPETYGSHTLLVDFEGGKVTGFRKIDNNDRTGGVQLR